MYDMFVAMTVRPTEDCIGRVLDPDGRALGTCFQVAPGVLVTAFHVVAGPVGRSVLVEAVDDAAGRAPARVTRVDVEADLAVLERDRPLAASISGFATADTTPPGAEVLVTGAGSGLAPGWTQVFGIWHGGTVRDARVPLGRLTSDAVTPLMSGAPVVRASDGLVVGLVTSRYNSSDGWLRNSVWISRAESIEQLLGGLVPAAVPPGDAADVTLTITDSTVRIGEASAQHEGPDGLLHRLLDDLAGTRAGLAGGHRPEIDGRLRRAGDLMARSFLREPVRRALYDALRDAHRRAVPLRLAVRASAFADLPWEAMHEPETDRPLALHPDVTMYRHVESDRRLEPAAGPLRIVVAIAAPDDADYETELREILAAVRPARRLGAIVRILPFATARAIRDAFRDDPAHVLHLVCAGEKDAVVLEDDDGRPEPVPIGDLIDGPVAPSVVVVPAPDARIPERLVRAGVACVIGLDAVGARFATALHTRVYADLVEARVPDVLPIVAEARRVVHQQLRDSYNAPDQAVARREEWSAVRLAASAASVPVHGPDSAAPEAPPPGRSAGVLSRPAGRFVGRRWERRTLPPLLDPGSDGPGVLLHGLGGVGKTTLAEMLVQRATEREPERPVAIITGQISVDGLLAAVADALRAGAKGHAATALEACARPDLPWIERFGLLRRTVLGDRPVLIVLDNFEDNLVAADADRSGWQVADSALAGLLDAWLADPGRSRFVVTSRYPFAVGARARLHEHRVGPLSLAETLTLIWSLPHLDRLEEPDVERVWRMVGGHPRTLEYLDALLGGGVGQYDDLTARLAGIVERLGVPESGWLSADRDVDTALADSLALMAEDVLIDEHLARLTPIPGAVRLLVGASVYREPVDRSALLFQVGERTGAAAADDDERLAASDEARALLGDRDVASFLADDDQPRADRDRLLALVERIRRPPAAPITTDVDVAALLKVLADTSLLHVEPESGAVFVHRWTAAELDRRLRAGLRADELTDAHRRAAAYWTWRFGAWLQDEQADVHDLLEARHHLVQAGAFEDAGRVTEAICGRFDDWGAWDREGDLIQDTLRILPADSPRRVAWVQQLGQLAHRRGDYAEAERRYREALALAERFGDHRAVATSHHQLGILAQDRGDYAEAERGYQAAVEGNSALGNRADLSRSYNQLGSLAQLRGDYAEAGRWYEQSLAIKEETGDRSGLARSHHQLGLLAQDRGDYGEAERRFQQALRFAEELGDQAAMATTYHQLGNLAIGTGDLATAERRYRQALSIADRLGDRPALARGYHQLGVLAQERGDLAEAERNYRQSLSISREIGNQQALSATLGQLASVAAARGDFAGAESGLRESLVISELLGDRANMARAYHQLGIVAHQEDRRQEALDLYARAQTIGEELGDVELTAAATYQIGVLAWEDDEDAGAAVPLLLGSLVRGLQIRSPDVVASARLLLTIRAAVGDARFREIAATVLDDDSLESLLGVLESLRDAE